MALYHIGTRHHPAVHVLCIHAPDAHRSLEVIGVRLVGIASHVAAIVEAAAQTQAWDAPVIEARHVARAGEVVLLEDSVVGIGGPAVAVEAVGIEPGHHHGLVVKAGPPAAELSSHLCSGGMPGAGQYAGLALGAHGAEEEDGLMVRVRQAYGHYHVSHAHIEGVVHVVMWNCSSATSPPFSTSVSYSPFSVFSISYSVPTPPASNSISMPSAQCLLNL